MTRLLILPALLLLAGCPPEGGSAGPSAECRKAYEQCVLPDGPLGVCEIDPSGECETPPCLVCTPQH